MHNISYYWTKQRTEYRSEKTAEASAGYKPSALPQQPLFIVFGAGQGALFF